MEQFKHGSQSSFPVSVWSFCQHLAYKCEQTLKPWTGSYSHSWVAFWAFLQVCLFTLACFNYSLLFSGTSENVKPATCCVTMLTMAENPNKPTEDPTSYLVLVLVMRDDIIHDSPRCEIICVQNWNLVVRCETGLATCSRPKSADWKVQLELQVQAVFWRIA